MPTASKPPVRGTQTFVGVMSAVWGRPSLTGFEIAWRWFTGLLLLSLGGSVVVVHTLGNVSFDTGQLQGLTVFQPVAAMQSLHAALVSFLAQWGSTIRWFFPVAAILWLIASSLGRTLVLRRLDTELHRRTLTFFVLTALRVALLMATWTLWLWALRWAVRSLITAPAMQGAEPDLILFCAALIVATLGLYVLWAIVSWPLYLAPLLAMLRNQGVAASLTAAFRAGPVGGKLLEINLVMHIVKLALIVLAMVLSASPLAFSTVATQTFYAAWWTVAVLLYFAASDYFHVVRSAAYLRLWRAYQA